jgi:hypothetical protein
MKFLTKTDFILYKECEKNVWIKWHRSEDYKKFPVSEFEKSLGLMGEDVEKEARKRFTGGILIPDRSEKSVELTKELITKKTPVIFQAVFTTEKYLAATDVIKWNEKANAYDLYEIKMSSTTEEGSENEKIDRKKETQYEYDLAFQTNVAKLCGINFNNKYLIRLNNEYVRHGELDYKNLFEETNKTEILSDVFLSVVETEMNSAYEYLSQKEEPKGHCRCYYERGRSSHCTTFSLSNPDATGYTVHDLNRIGNSKKLLGELLNDGILNIDDISIADERLIPKRTKNGEPGKPKKLNQVKVYKTKEPIIDIDSIKAELNSLKYPLYFLDYETYPTAIPPFDGYRPYQHIVFQYSLHILRSRDAELEHRECLIFEGDPAPKLVESLRKDIGDTGSVISWYKAFENSRNRELAEMLPEYADFLHSVVDRTYDLMDIVDKQYYVHHGFKGSSSIKKIQPVIAPDFSYKELDVKNGTEAIEAYKQATSGKFTAKELETKKSQMLKYCEYDTLVMYKIWKFFTELVEENKK